MLLRRVFGYFRPHRRRGLLVVACVAAEAVLGLAPALVFKALIDYLARPGGEFVHVLLLVGAGIAAAVVGGLIGVVESYLTSLISQGIMFELRRELFDRLLDQSVDFFTKSRSGEVMSRLSNDVDGVEDVVADTVFGLVRNLLITVASLVLMLLFSWQLTLVVLVLIPLVALPARHAGKATYHARMATQNKLAEMTAYLQEVLGVSGILLVKAFVKGRAERTRFGRINDQLRRLQVRQEIIGRWFGMLMSTVQIAGPALIILAGGYLVIHGETTVGTVFVFATVLGPGSPAPQRRWPARMSTWWARWRCSNGSSSTSTCHPISPTRRTQHRSAGPSLAACASSTSRSPIRRDADRLSTMWTSTSRRDSSSPWWVRAAPARRR